MIENEWARRSSTHPDASPDPASATPHHTRIAAVHAATAASSSARGPASSPATTSAGRPAPVASPKTRPPSMHRPASNARVRAASTSSGASAAGANLVAACAASASATAPRPAATRRRRRSRPARTRTLHRVDESSVGSIGWASTSISSGGDAADSGIASPRARRSSANREKLAWASTMIGVPPSTPVSSPSCSWRPTIHRGSAISAASPTSRSVVRACGTNRGQVAYVPPGSISQPLRPARRGGGQSAAAG